MAKESAQKVVHYKGATYVGKAKGGKIHVFTKRTAKGQNLLISVYDPIATAWYDKGTLPTFVKKELECSFAI